MAEALRREQRELKNIRPPEVIELEDAIWQLKEAKEEHKKSKENVDEKTEAVASKLRKFGQPAYGFTRSGEFVTATVEDQQVVKLQVAKPKKKPTAAERASAFAGNR